MLDPFELEVFEDCEQDHGRRFGSQDPPAEPEPMGTAIAGSLGLGMSKTTFGADDDEHAARAGGYSGQLGAVKSGCLARPA